MNYGGRPFRGPGPYGGGPWGGPGPSRPPFQQRPFPPSPFQQPPHRQQYQQQYGPPHTQPPPTSYPQRLPPSHTASHSNPGPPMQAQHHMRPPRNSPTPASASSGDTEKVPFVGYEATVYIGMENAPAEFGLELRLSGEKGANLDYLSQATKAKVVLWGHGTGINERKPLHLYIVHDTLKGKEEAVSLANHLVRTVKDELCDWRKEQDLLKHRKTSHKRRSRSPRSRSPLSDAEPPDEKRSRRTMRGRSPVERDEKHHRSSDPKAGPAEAKQADNSQRTQDRQIAANMDRYNVFMITDGRGATFESALQMRLSELKEEGSDIYLHTTIAIGAKLDRLRDIAYHHLKTSQIYYDLVVVSGGVNNLTREEEDSKIAPVFDHSDQLVAEMCVALYGLRARLWHFCARVMITDIIGVDLNECNRNCTDYEHSVQTIIDNGVVRLNRYIRFMNQEEDLHTPNIGDLVHVVRTQRNVITHRYKQHLADGFQYKPRIAERVAKLIAYKIEIEWNKVNSSGMTDGEMEGSCISGSDQYVDEEVQVAPGDKLPL